MSVARHAIDEPEPVASRLHLPLAERPRARAECVDGPRPCPWTHCRHHLASDIDERSGRGRFVLRAEVSTMRESCALDVADRGGATLEEVGRVLRLTRERIRQIQVSALEHVVVQLFARGIMSRDEAIAALRTARRGFFRNQDAA